MRFLMLRAWPLYFSIWYISLAFYDNRSLEHVHWFYNFVRVIIGIIGIICVLCPYDLFWMKLLGAVGVAHGIGGMISYAFTDKAFTSEFLTQLIRYPLPGIILLASAYSAMERITRERYTPHAASQ